MKHKVSFVNPSVNYLLIKDEIDKAYFEVMSKGDLVYSKHTGIIKTIK